MLGKLFIAFRPCFLTPKIKIDVLPSAPPKAVRCSENRTKLRSQDACVLVPSKAAIKQVTLESHFPGFLNCKSKGLSQIISQFLSRIDIICPESPMIPQV